jgi:hypothetical protein
VLSETGGVVGAGGGAAFEVALEVLTGFKVL